jgi:transcriptional regulator with XRE-family HTH domain
MLSQQEVADRAGTSLFTIQRIERGEGNVRPRTGRGVAAALGVPIEELLPKAQAPLPDFDVQERRAPVLDGPFAWDAEAGELAETPGPDVSDLALEAARRQAVQDIQAANRALSSGQAQAYFMRHENEAMHRLMEYPTDELAAAVLELARRCIELEGALHQARAANIEQDAEEARRGSA